MIEKITDPIIEIHDLTVSYHNTPVLWDVDLTLPQGKLIGIVGPNGAGKSTLFKAMMGILKSSSGYVKFFNQPLNKVRKRISYVPQRQSVDWNFPALVEDVVMMGRYVHMGFFKRPKQIDRQIVATCLAQVGMSKLAKRQIGALSGGQKQRVFLARALAQEADIYLLDEPFDGVDVNTEQLTLKILQDLTSQNKSVLIIHHGLESIARFCDYTILLNLYVRAFGPTPKVLIPSLLSDTYGKSLAILSDIHSILQKRGLPVREDVL